VKVAFAESIKKDYPEFAARILSLSGVATPLARSSTQRIDWLKDLSANETFVAAKLTEAEQKKSSIKWRTPVSTFPILGRRNCESAEFRLENRMG